jgi:hypothetical protein
MGELLERAFTEQRLLEAWADVREAALAGCVNLIWPHLLL